MCLVVGLTVSTWAFYAAGEDQGCGMVGGSSGVTISVPRVVRAQLETISVELSQEGQTRQVDFPSREQRGDDGSLSLADGVVLSKNLYAVRLGEFGKGWEGDGRDASLAVHGYGPDGHEVLRHDELFEFREYYPNGEGCDKTPHLLHDAHVVREDLVAPAG